MPESIEENPNQEEEVLKSSSMDVLKNIKIYISSVYSIFFPRIIVIFLIWGIFRVLLYFLSKAHNKFFMPYISELGIDIMWFLATIIDIWFVSCIIGFLFFIWYKIFEEIKKW